MPSFDTLNAYIALTQKIQQSYSIPQNHRKKLDIEVKMRIRNIRETAALLEQLLKEDREGQE